MSDRGVFIRVGFFARAVIGVLDACKLVDGPIKHVIQARDIGVDLEIIVISVILEVLTESYGAFTEFDKGVEYKCGEGNAG